MKIKRKDVNDFLQLASNIKLRDSILPINLCVKLEKGAFTKTNGKTFITHQLELEEHETMLIDENILSTWAKSSVDEYLEVTIVGKDKKKKIVISDSRDKDDVPYIDPKDFTKFPDKDKESETYLDTDVLGAIGIASKNVLVEPDKNGETPANFDFVHLSENYVFASDINVMYARKFESLPTVSLSADCARTICVLPYVNFYQKGNYDFFQCNQTLYAFVQSANIKIPAIPAVLVRLTKGENSTMNTAELIGFCDKVTRIIPPRPNKDVTYAEFRGNQLVCEDSDYSINLHREISLVGDFKPEIKFVPRRLGDYFKSIGATDVTIGKSPLNPNALTVWDNDDEAMVGMIAGITLNS